MGKNSGGASRAGRKIGVWRIGGQRMAPERVRALSTQLLRDSSQVSSPDLLQLEDTLNDQQREIVARIDYVEAQVDRLSRQLAGNAAPEEFRRLNQERTDFLTARRSLADNLIPINQRLSVAEDTVRRRGLTPLRTP